MGELGREALFVSQARRDALEHRVERCRKVCELVVRRAEIEPLVEIMVAPGGCVVSHARNRLQSLSKDPMRDQRDGAQEQDREHDRADKGDRCRLVIRIERNARNDGADLGITVDDG